MRTIFEKFNSVQRLNLVVNLLHTSTIAHDGIFSSVELNAIRIWFDGSPEDIQKGIDGKEIFIFLNPKTGYDGIFLEDFFDTSLKTMQRRLMYAVKEAMREDKTDILLCA